MTSGNNHPGLRSERSPFLPHQIPRLLPVSLTPPAALSRHSFAVELTTMADRVCFQTRVQIWQVQVDAAKALVDLTVDAAKDAAIAAWQALVSKPPLTAL